MNKLPIPNIVRSFQIGNTTIKIADNYCKDVTEEEVEQILSRIARTLQPYFSAGEIAEKQDA